MRSSACATYRPRRRSRRALLQPRSNSNNQPKKEDLMTRKMLATAAFLIAALPATAHEVSKGPNGGRVVEAGPYHVELVVETKAVAVYVSDAKEKPVPAAGFKGLVILTVS